MNTTTRQIIFKHCSIPNHFYFFLNNVYLIIIMNLMAYNNIGLMWIYVLDWKLGRNFTRGYLKDRHIEKIFLPQCRRVWHREAINREATTKKNRIVREERDFALIVGWLMPTPPRGSQPADLDPCITRDPASGEAEDGPMRLFTCE